MNEQSEVDEQSSSEVDEQREVKMFVALHDCTWHAV